jgi:peptidoglycan/LPS O-acetylase OafA/YrhL
LMYLVLPVIAILGIRNRFRLAMVFIAAGIVFAISSPFLHTIPGAPFLFVRNANDLSIGYLEQFFPLVLLAYGFGLLAYLGKVPSGNTRYLIVVGLGGLTTLSILAPNLQDFYLQILFYLIAIIGFSAVISNPFNVLRWFTFFGEESYALYALHVTFLILFGLVAGLPLLIGSSFLIELTLRPRQILHRLKLAYATSPRNEKRTMTQKYLAD